ncbi:MAG TPA: PDZ domain-containing protein, partial [Candidatus Baltobacteraceae bacterium]|jgi:carboxyl-terminal processing protease|nr:PDZ domain-containing protein [Candidatus Baltobacteraceae bacterium]
MALVPNADAQFRDEYERSGLFLVNMGGKFAVADARPGTPSADAGIMRGDVIVAIDGKSTAGMSLDQIREAFRAPAGTVVHLTLASKSKAPRQVTLTLRDYV